MSLQGFNALEGKSCPGAEKLCSSLLKQNVDFATGIPCGVLNHIISGINSEEKIQKVSCQNEPEGIGIAAGAYLAGKTPVVYLQNSGLLKSANDIGSLLLPYQIPVFFISSYRGCPGEDAPQHLVTGRATKGIIELLGMDFIEGTEENIKTSVDLLYARMRNSKKPSVLLLKRNWAKEIEVNQLKNIEEKKDSYLTPDLKKSGQIIDLRNGKNAAREDALDAIIYSISEKEAVFSGTGLMSRSIYERYDSENKFYVTGSFGLVSSMGLGFASVQKNIKSVIIDGDSSILTNFSSLVSIAKENPRNLVHIILDNNSYASCSEERSCSNNARIPEIASCLGYDVYLADSSDSIALAFKDGMSSERLSMVYAYTKLGGRRDFKRPLDLPQISGRFRNYFSGSTA